MQSSKNVQSRWIHRREIFSYAQSDVEVLNADGLFDQRKTQSGARFTEKPLPSESWQVLPTLLSEVDSQYLRVL